VPKRLRLAILQQPDDSTCGPTCLHAVYSYYRDAIPLRSVISEVSPLETGGTLAVQLACHALKRGYAATIYTYNLTVFDPSWFEDDVVDIPQRLEQQARAKPDRKLRTATRAYLEFLSLGGRLRYEELRPRLIRRHLDRRQPLLTGLSATYLYRCPREVGEHELEYDDVRGTPTGHFVVLHGYGVDRHRVLVADPYMDNPRFRSHSYTVSMDRLIGAILLGVLTFDANLLVLEPA